MAMGKQEILSENLLEGGVNDMRSSAAELVSLEGELFDISVSGL